MSFLKWVTSKFLAHPAWSGIASITAILTFVIAIYPNLSVDKEKKIEMKNEIKFKKNTRLKALVIGNSKYKHGSLVNSINDAKDISDFLTSIGFQVTELINEPKKSLIKKIRSYYLSNKKEYKATGLSRYKEDDSIFFTYYSGHSVEVNGTLYIVPIDFKNIKNKIEIRRNLISLYAILPEGNNIIKSNKYILFSTSSGKTVEDGTRTNSPFTQKLLEELTKKNLDVYSVFTNVRRGIKKKTHGEQVPSIQVSADEKLSLSKNIIRSYPKGGASIEIIDGGRDNPFKYWGGK